MRMDLTQFTRVLLLCGLSATAVFSQCQLPAAPGAGSPDPDFNSLVTQNGPGWTGGDGTYSLRLPDGTDLWMWSDSYIGTVDPQTRLRSNWLFTAHNSLTVQTGTTTMSTVGYPPQTTSYFVPSNPADWFWQGAGIVTQPSAGVYKIKIVLLEWTGVYQFQGISIATLSYPSLTIDSIDPVPLPDLSIEWGSQLLRLGNYIYLYGIKDPGTWQKQPHVARMSSVNDLTNPAAWQFWNATQKAWLSGQSNATPLAGVPAITNEYTVTRHNAATGPFYVMTGMDTWNPPYPGWKNVVMYYSCQPQGPWQKRTIVYVTPETGAPGCKTGTLLTYNPKIHAEFTSAAGVLVSYNVNAGVGQDLVCADDYKPRFIRVPIQGLTP
jgi:hypothetical protein